MTHASSTLSSARLRGLGTIVMPPEETVAIFIRICHSELLLLQLVPEVRDKEMRKERAVPEPQWGRGGRQDGHAEGAPDLPGESRQRASRQLHGSPSPLLARV